MSLHVHSMYSALDGISTPDEIALRTIEIGKCYCGLTDHGVVAGHLAFDKSMRSRGLKPCFGIELYHGNFPDNLKGRDQAHLLALAMTDEGLKNLWRLVDATAQQSRFHFVGRVTWEDLERYREGIHFTSACPLGMVPQGLLRGDTEPLNRYLEILGDGFSLEVTTYPGDAQWDDMDVGGEAVPVTPRIVNELVIEHAQERGVMVTVGDDGHYAFRSQYPMHDLYLALQLGQSIHTPIEERKMWHPEGALCIKDEEETREALSYLPDHLVDEFIANTDLIGERADAHLPAVDRPHMPVFVPSDCPWLEEGDPRDAMDVFLDLIEAGIQRHYAGSEREEEAWARAAHEAAILVDADIWHYFLIGWDLMQFCDEGKIARGPGRGSAGGSIIAYALGITDVDPLHYDLYFERFWNAGRTEGFPDIDSDFARSRRVDIREYLIERWKNVCSIGTITRMKPKAVAKRLSKGCEISYAEVDEVLAILDDVPDIDIHGVNQIGWSEEIEPGKVIYVERSVGDELEAWIESGANSSHTKERRRLYIEMCRQLCSRNEGYGIHPSGIVVADIPLAAYAPAAWRGDKKTGIPATMFPMSSIDDLRLIKLDVLGLKTLDMLTEWEGLVAEKGVEVDWSGLDKEEFPDEMWQLLADGFVAGIFQAETKGGKQLTVKLRPRSVEDLGVLVALNNPGPMRAGVPAKYFARKDGREEVTYPHPMLEEVLEPTYGLFIYQEQVIRFFGDLGYSLTDADAIRKILGKKQPEKLKAIFEGTGEWQGKGFHQIALERGFSEKVISSIWRDLEGFASYSFNKSHSIEYGIIAFRCLFAKYYAPAEFYTACIRTVEKTKKEELMPQYIKEARRMGIKVLPPDVRFSRDECAAYDGQIYFGFSNVKDVGTSGKYLMRLRDEVGVDISSPESFCEGLEEINDSYLEGKKVAAKEGSPYPKGNKSPKQQINAKKINAIFEVGGWDGLGKREVSLRDRQEKEREYLGVLLSDDVERIVANNPEAFEEAEEYDDVLMPWEEKAELYDWEDVPEAKRKLQYELVGVINYIRPTKTRAAGKAMGIVTIEHGKHELEFVVFPAQWKSYKFLFKERAVGKFTVNQTARGYNFEAGELLR